MSLKPAGRYAGADELAADIERWLADEPVKAYTEPAAARASRWMRKHPATVAIVAAVLLLAAPLAGMLAWVGDGARRRAEADRLKIEGEQEETERERAKAVRLAARNRKIGAFYEKYILSAPRPLGGGQAFDVSLKQALDQASPHIGEAFAEEQADELAVSRTLGQTYISLRDYAKAEGLLLRAAELAKALHGERSREYVEAYGLLGEVRISRGNAEPGVRMLEANAKAAADLLGPSDPLTLTSLHNRAFGLLQMGRLAEAEAAFREVVKARTEALGPYAMETLESAGSLAQVLTERGRYADAEKAYRELLPLLRRLAGPDHQHTLSVEHNIADVLARGGDAKKAARVIEAVVYSRLRVCGQEHLDTLGSQALQAQCLNELARPQEAEALFLRILPILVRRAGADGRLTLTCRDNLIFSRIRLGRLDEAEKEAREIIATRVKAYGQEDHQTLGTQDILAYIAILQKRPKLLDETEGMLARTVPIAEKVLGPTHPRTGNMIGNHVGVLMSRNKHVESLPLLWKLVSRGLLSAELPGVFTAMRAAQPKMPADPRRDWETRLLAAWSQMENKTLPAAEKELRAFLAARAFTDADWQRHAASSLLGDCLLRQKKYVEAQPLLLAGHEGLTKIRECPPERIAEARARLARLYVEWGKPDKAAAWK
jgi:tetratricopeptide (TPR) repeat protein